MLNTARMLQNFPWNNFKREKELLGKRDQTNQERERKKITGIPKGEEYGFIHTYIYIMCVYIYSITKVELSFEVGLVRRLDG